MKNCPICESPLINQNYIRFNYADKNYSLSKCAACNCLFYENDFFFDFKENFEHNRNLKTYLEKTSDFEGLMTIVKNFFSAFPEKTFFGIDIGCGTGIIMDFSQTLMGKKMLGFEPSLQYSREGRESLKLDIIDDFFSSEYLKNKKADFVVCFQVLQLEKKPHCFIKEIRQALSNEGILFLSTPDNKGLTENVVTEEYISLLSPGVHRCLFSKQSLYLALSKGGFQNINIYERDGQLFALASNRELRDIDLFVPDRESVLKYYETRLSTLSEETSYFRGIWYRLYRNRLDNGEYDEALALLKKADWFEIWDEDEIEAIQNMDKLFELNSFADAIIYYYTGILFLNHLGKYEYSEKFFRLSYLLSNKIIHFHSEMSVIERDIVWLAKLHGAISLLYKGNKEKAKEVLTEIIGMQSIGSNGLPKPSKEVLKKAKEILKEVEHK